MEVKLYVGNLSYSTTEDELQELFGQAGKVVSVAIIKDRETNRSKGFGFVEMSTQAEAEKAISMFNAYALNDRNLTVNVARPREERSGGGYRGGSGGRGRSSYNDRDRYSSGGSRGRSSNRDRY